jgi:magnesium-transporting ATPase (P-type)
MRKVKAFIHNNPVRVAAFVSSAVALIVSFVVPDVPTEPAIAFVLSALGLGEFAQRAEDKKTAEALLTEVPEIAE